MVTQSRRRAPQSAHARCARTELFPKETRGFFLAHVGASHRIVLYCTGLVARRQTHSKPLETEGLAPHFWARTSGQREREREWKGEEESRPPQLTLSLHTWTLQDNQWSLHLRSHHCSGSDSGWGQAERWTAMECYGILFFFLTRTHWWCNSIFF